MIEVYWNVHEVSSWRRVDRNFNLLAADPIPCVSSVCTVMHRPLLVEQNTALKVDIKPDLTKQELDKTCTTQLQYVAMLLPLLVGPFHRTHATQLCLSFWHCDEYWVCRIFSPSSLHVPVFRSEKTLRPSNELVGLQAQCWISCVKDSSEHWTLMSPGQPVCPGHLQPLCHYAYDILLSDCDRQHLWHPMICPHLAALPPNVAQQRQQRDHTCWCSNGETSHGQPNRRNTNPSQRTLSQRRRWLPRPK